MGAWMRIYTKLLYRQSTFYCTSKPCMVVLEEYAGSQWIASRLPICWLGPCTGGAAHVVFALPLMNCHSMCTCACSFSWAIACTGIGSCLIFSTIRWLINYLHHRHFSEVW